MAVSCLFYIGLHQPSDGHRFERAFISVNRIRRRKKRIGAKQWIMDSGAFSELKQYGRYRHSPGEYAEIINRFADDPALVAAVSQDYMCEPFILAKTGLTVKEHQRLTIERYIALRALCPKVYIMPVLQGYTKEEYLDHLGQYGDLLERGAYVGVGSVCKRNTNVAEIEGILLAIRAKRPDLRLHGFGLKTTALRSGVARECLYSADSMAWSYAARKRGGDANDWKEAARFNHKIETQAIQLSLPMEASA